MACTFPVAAESFTFQGRLENSGVPFTGTASIRLGLFATTTGGSAIQTESFNNVTVADGVFSVTANRFLAADFTGGLRFLNIEVSTDGSNYTALVPRQEVTWAPLAMHARKAEALTGTVAASQITGTLSPSTLGTGTITAPSPSPRLLARHSAWGQTPRW